MVLKRIYLFAIIGLSLISLVSYSKINLLPANNIFELLILVAFCLVRKEINKRFSILQISFALYVFNSFCWNVLYLNVNVFDFLVASKSLFYICILPFFINKEVFDKEFIRKLFKFLLFVFTIKYILTIAFTSNDRPGVFTENNFELLFLLIIASAYKDANGKISLKEYMILILIFFVSGSRSGLGCLLFFILVNESKKLDFVLIVKYTLVFILMSLTFYVAKSRLGSGGVESIDRFVFFEGFIYSIRDWGILNYIFGNIGLKPLDPHVCSSLSFYETLFSYSGDGSCYSELLHSYDMRIIYDQGVLGLIFIFSSIYYFLKLSRLSTRSAISIIGIMFLNGLSVSSINSAYCVVGLIILFAREKHKLENQY